MPTVPRQGEVRRAFRQSELALKQCRKQLDARAGKLLARGKYSQAETLVSLATRVRAYAEELSAVHARFRDLGKRGGTKRAARIDEGGGATRGEGSARAAKKPMRSPWEYYVPIMKSLAALGSDADSGELEREFQTRFGAWLLPGDLQRRSGGRAVWQRRVRGAKRHLVSEGLVSAPNLRRWRLTAAGEKAAAGAPDPTADSDGQP